MTIKHIRETITNPGLKEALIGTLREQRQEAHEAKTEARPYTGGYAYHRMTPTRASGLSLAQIRDILGQ